MSSDPSRQRYNTEPATWQDIQDLRRVMQGHIDTKIIGLKRYVEEEFKAVHASVDKLEAGVNELKELIRSKQ